MSVHTRASLIRKHPLGGYETMSVACTQATSGTEFSVTVTAPPRGGALVGDTRLRDAGSHEEMQAAFDAEIAAARADGWEIEFTEEDGPDGRHVRNPSAGVS